MWSTGYYATVDNKSQNQFSHTNWGTQTANYCTSIDVIQPAWWAKIFDKVKAIMAAPVVQGVIELNSDAEHIADPHTMICESDMESETKL